MNCGCTDWDPCMVHDVPCCWVHGYDPGDVICSSCAPVELLVLDPEGWLWLKMVHANALKGSLETFQPCDAWIAREMEGRP